MALESHRNRVRKICKPLCASKAAKCTLTYPLASKVLRSPHTNFTKYLGWSEGTMIKSRHNIYPAFSNRVVERWQKSTVMAIGGKRLNPYKASTGEDIDFLLMSRDEDFDLATRVLKFHYESEIVELYSQDEVELFRALNRSAIERGLLKPYQELAPAVDTSNVLTDSDIVDILNITNHLKLKARLKQITALPVLERIKAGITDNHKQWFSKLVEARRLELV